MAQSIKYMSIERFRKLAMIMGGAGILGLLFYAYLHFSEMGRFPNLVSTTREIIASFVIGSTVGLTLYYFNHLLDASLPWRRYFAGRFLLGYLSNTIIAWLSTLGLAWLVITISGDESFWKGLSRKDEDLILKATILFIAAVFIYKVVYALLYSYQHYAIAQIETLQSERKQLELQFEALKGQISPHYLFNSLNTISSLLFKDLPSAEQFIRRLAQTYQYILATQNRKYVLLKEEVDFVQSYYYLLRIRFQQQLSVEINLPNGIMNSKIPPLTLQMLVENAVKHNAMSSDKKLFIYITAQDNTYLKVINTKTGVLDSVASFRVGLENIRKRYQYFTDRKIEVKDEEKFVVSLPVIQPRQEAVEQKYFIHNPLFRIIAPPVYGILIYCLILLINNNVTQINDLFVSEEVYVCIGLTYIAFECIRFLIILQNKFFHDVAERVRIPFQFILTSFVAVVLVIVCLRLYFAYTVGFSISGTQLRIFIVIFTVTALLYNVLYFSNYYLQKENTLKLNAEKQQRDMLEMEMMEFKNEINPDLLYESLENLIGLMYRDVEQAEEYIDSLASAYRYVLANRQQELVPVRTELEAARVMIKLLNEKYYGQLRFEPSLDDDQLDFMLIPGSLPVILEGMIRNTIITRFEPFVIRCYVEDDYITVQSKLNDKLIMHPGSETALARLQKSYSVYSDLPLIKVKAYQENYVKLPVITVAEEIALS
jgi:LytS/YehU family sensor histidine kinase